MSQPQADDSVDSAPDEELSDEVIEKVAEVLVQIKDVRNKYRKKIHQTSNQKKIVTYQRKMTLEIDRTIEQYDGMSIDRYEEITQAAQSDFRLKQRILSLTKKKRGNADVKASGK